MNNKLQIYFCQALLSVRIAGLFLSTDYTDYTDFFLLPTDNTKNTNFLFLSTDYTDYTDFFLLPTDNTKSTNLFFFFCHQMNQMNRTAGAM